MGHDYYSLWQKAPYKIWWKLSQADSKMKLFKNFMILYMYTAQGQGQTAPGDRIYSVTKEF